LFYVSNSSYHSRLYPITIIPDIFYNFTFYLPPIISTGPGGPPGGNITGTYMIQIISTLSGESYEQQITVSDALVKFYRYFNTTAEYTYIGGFVSDGNGQGSIDLYPYQLYMIKITCTGYDNKIEFWTPNLVEQGLMKIFKIVFSSVIPPMGNYTDFLTTVVFTATMNSTNVTQIYYYDRSGNTIDTQIYFYMFYEGYTTFIISDSRIGQQSFYWNITGLNKTRTYIAVLYFNTTNDFNLPVNSFTVTVWPLGPFNNNPKFDIEDRITDVFGDFRVGSVVISWIGVFCSLIPLIVLTLFDQANVGIGILVTGFFMGGIQAGLYAWTVNAPPPLVIILIPVIIVIGVLYLLAQRNGYL